MNEGQRDKLFELHRYATQLWGLASLNPKHWPEAYAADKAFTDYLNSLHLDPHYKGNGA